MSRSGRNRRSRGAVAQQGFRLGENRRLRADLGEAAAAVAAAANHQVAEVRAEAVRAAEQFAVVQDAEPEAAVDVDDEKVVEVARLPEPVLGERDQIDVAVDRRRNAEAPGEIRAERHVALAGRSGSAGTLRRRARRRRAGRRRRRRRPRSSRPASLTQRRTPSSTRSAMTAAVCRSMRIGIASERRMSAQKLVTATVIWSGASFTPTTCAASGLSSSITRGRPRPASRTAPTCSGMISRSSSSAAVMAETVVGLSSVNCEISTRDTGPEPPDRVHHMEAIDRAHQFRVGGLHRSLVFPPRRIFMREAELFSSPAEPVNRDPLGDDGHFGRHPLDSDEKSRQI